MEEENTFTDILDQEIDIISQLKDLPNSNFILSIIKSNLGVKDEEEILEKLDEDTIQTIYNSIESIAGGYSAEKAHEILMRPLLLDG